MTLITDIKKQINTTKNATIKKILEKHFNPDANSLSFVFNQIHKKNDRANDREWLDNQAREKKGCQKRALSQPHSLTRPMPFVMNCCAP